MEQMKAQKMVFFDTAKEARMHASCWEHYSNPIPASLFRGGAPVGIVSFVRALVEFPEGMGYVVPKDIRFCDETHAYLCAWDKNMKENEDDQASGILSRWKRDR